MSSGVVLITGTSTGIGQATALHLARRGYRVHATMRSPERAATPLLDAARAEGLELTAAQLDVTDPASVRRAVDAVLAESGRIDVLVNNAGLGDLVMLENSTDEQARAMFDTNVLGALRTIRAVLPGMRERDSGTIVNVSSVAGHVVGAGSGLYASTKHALRAMSEALALEVLQFGIRVAVIEPGFIATPIIDKATSTLSSSEDSSYAATERRMNAVYQGAKPLAGHPQLVAEAIEHAIRTDDPKHRYLVGFDAAPFLDGRKRMTDEEYIEAFGRVQTDEEWFTEFAARFPMPATV